MAHSSFYYQQARLTNSMSRKGNCLDNVMMESISAVLKVECFYTQRLKSIDVLQQQLHAYIHYYNHGRIKAKLDGLSSVQYGLQLQKHYLSQKKPHN